MGRPTWRVIMKCLPPRYLTLQDSHSLLITHCQVVDPKSARSCARQGMAQNGLKFTAGVGSKFDINSFQMAKLELLLRNMQMLLRPNVVGLSSACETKIVGTCDLAENI
jgi:hypothetical protein